MTERQQEELEAMLRRFIEEYSWRMGVVRPCINYYFDVNFSIPELWERYQQIQTTASNT